MNRDSEARRQSEGTHKFPWRFGLLLLICGGLVAAWRFLPNFDRTGTHAESEKARYDATAEPKVEKSSSAIVDSSAPPALTRSPALNTTVATKAAPIATATPQELPSAGQRTPVPAPGLASGFPPITLQQPTANSSAVGGLALEWLSVNSPSDITKLTEEGKKVISLLALEFPDDPDALEVKARFHLLIGEVDAARESWTRAIKAEPNYAYAHHGLGQVHMKSSEFEAAEISLKKAFEGLPQNADVAHDLSDAFLKQSKFDESIGTLRKFLDANPNSTATYVLLGQTCMAAKKYAEAKDAFQIALKQIPDIPKAQLGLGNALVRLGDREEAQKWLTLQASARQSEQTNHIPTPEEDFRGELVDSARRYVYAAQVFIKHNKFQEAEQVLRRAAVYDPTNEDSRVLLMSVYQSLGRPVDALALADELTKLAPTNPSYHFTRGILNARQGSYDIAEASFRKVIELAPENSKAYGMLCQMYLQLGKSGKEVTALAEKSAKLSGTASDFANLSQAYTVEGNLPGAVDAMQQAVRLDPASQNFQLILGQLQSELRKQK